jgi:nicotinamidase-related amidase
VSLRLDAATPYAWPFDGLRTEVLAVVIVGADGRWAGRCPNPERVAGAIQQLCERASALDVSIVTVCHRHDGRDCTQSPLAPMGDISVTAEGIDGCFGSALETVLRRTGRSQIAICGFGLEGPIHSTLRSLNDRGFECLTLSDASAPLEPSLAHAALSTIEMSGGIFGAVGTTRDLIRALEESP